MRRIIFLLFCFSGVGFGWAKAQNGGNDLFFADRENYDIRLYTSENGLPQNSATGLLLDKNDFLWITTQNGVARFDGRRFRIYDRSNTPAIKSNRFSVVAESSQREVLLGSSFDPAEVYKVDEDYKIHLYLKGLFDWAPLYNYFSEVRSAIEPMFLDRLRLAEKFMILNDSEMVVRDSPNVWYYLNNSSPRVHRLSMGVIDADPHVFVLQGIFCVFSEKEGWLFFKHGREIPVHVDETVSELIKRVPGRGGNQAIIRHKNDIYELTLGNNSLKAELIFPDLKLLDNIIATSYLHDKKNHRLFIATATTGFVIVTKRPFKTLTFRSPDRLDNDLNAFLLLSGKKVLTGNGILNRSNSNDQLLFRKELRPDGNCFYRARNGSIWISRGKLLHIYDSSFSRELAVDSLELDSRITCIIEGAGQTVWISTLTSLLKIEEGRLKYVLRRVPAFASHYIESVAEISSTELWIGSRNGIYVYDIANGRISDEPILPGVYARHFYRAKDKSIWIGTYGNGYYKYHMGRFVSLPVDERNYLSTTHAFLEDEFGFFWISTNQGLFRIRKKDLDDFAEGKNNRPYFYHIDRSSGFNTNEFNGGCNPASQVDEQGNFYFPSLEGIVYFNPVTLHPEVPDKAIFVDQFFVDSARLDYRKIHAIKPDFHRLVVEVATPYYGAETNLKLEYTLDSGGGKWYPVSRDGRITINRLPHGKYALLVRKHNADEESGFTHLSIGFEVLPHWYSTWLFYCLAALVAGSFLFLLYKLRTRFLLRQNIRLQERVDERTAELAQSTLMTERLLSVIMHDLRSPMFSQALLIDHLHTNLHRLGKSELDDLFHLLKDSTSRICQFSTDFLIWHESQKQGFSIKIEEIELSGFIKDITVLYKNIAVRKGLTFELSVPDGLVLVSDRNILAIVIRNLVDNAVKYTGSGSVGIGANQGDGHVRIRVSDTGPGIPASKIAEITSYHEKDADTASSTFGYRFVMELVRKLDGEVEIESTLASGTSVVVSFIA